MVSCTSMRALKPKPTNHHDPRKIERGLDARRRWSVPRKSWTINKYENSATAMIHERPTCNRARSCYQPLGAFPPAQICRVIRRRSSCQPHRGWQYPLPSQNHSARKNSVGMRIVRDQSHSIPFRITRRFLRS